MSPTLLQFWREGLIGFLLLLLAAGGIFAWQEHVDKVAAQARIQPLQDQVEGLLDDAEQAQQVTDAARERADSAMDALAAAELRADSLEESSGREVDEASQVVVDAAASLDTVHDSIQAALDPLNRPLVDVARERVGEIQESYQTVEQAYQALQNEFQEFRRISAEAAEALRAECQACQNEVDRWRAAFQAEREITIQLRETSTPGILERAKRSIPLFSFEGTIAGGIGVLLGLALGG